MRILETSELDIKTYEAFNAIVECSERYVCMQLNVGQMEVNIIKKEI